MITCAKSTYDNRHNNGRVGKYLFISVMEIPGGLIYTSVSVDVVAIALHGMAQKAYIVWEEL